MVKWLSSYCLCDNEIRNIEKTSESTKNNTKILYFQVDLPRLFHAKSGDFQFFFEKTLRFSEKP